MTYEELAHAILNDFTPEQKKSDLTIFIDDEYYAATLKVTDNADDVLDAKHPFIEIIAWQKYLCSGDKVYFTDPEVIRSRFVTISKIEWVGDVAKITDKEGNYLECHVSELS